MNKRTLLILSGCVLAMVLTLMGVLTLFFGSGSVFNKSGERPTEVSVPATWDVSYIESAKDYEEFVMSMDDVDWETVAAAPDQIVITTTGISTRISMFAQKPHVGNQTDTDRVLAQLNEEDAWRIITNGVLTEYPTKSYSYYERMLTELRNTNTETITVDVWYWRYPDVADNLEKIAVQKTFAVNSVMADTFRHIFADIFADASQPVINIADKGMGTWVLRGKNHNSANTMSAHSLGVAIDINPSTGSYFVDGKWYGNGYKQAKMSYAMWDQLPETHTKYHILYDGCPIVEIFKSYGFYWGGDWTTTPDCMHISYLGDGSSARSTGVVNYNERR